MDTVNENSQKYKVPGGPTQPEIVAIALSKLEIEPDDLVADIGCGTGTVTVALAQKAKTVFAIDTREEAICCTEKHCLDTGCSNVCLMQGDAQSIIKTLDKIDRAFCGGSKGIEEIITLLYTRGTVRIVVTAVLLETVITAIQAMKENGMRCEVIHLQISRSTELAGRTMLIPINPVYIIIGSR
ncbi:MAG: precorrin-6Y C5,15-methyltransferase (decarboxylating) subunit CbiT [Methanomicrobiales archaeon]|jgi:cobalt-precorrin-6B (C15)-methyltransferase|nr:precorrin-6Y C5,15-methyltransferase (decarboxylating) subunit CbiT [Methanomicrobiales archaeon]